MQSNNHNQKVQHSFDGQAKKFNDARLTLANERYVQWILDSLPLSPTKKVIDIACGTGIMARAVAPHVAHVTAIDLTTSMLNEARALAQAQKLNNIQFEESSAEDTRFANNIFDLAITRFSVHHFQNPVVQLTEMARIVKLKGHVAVVDLMAPTDPHLAASYNRYEHLRDPSHTRALTFDQLQASVRDAGLNVIHTDVLGVEVNVERWLNLTQTPEAVANLIVRDLEREISGQCSNSGFFPFRGTDGALLFKQNWVMVFAIKS
jgi:ubiquinone/menaquinone biosynthesis C-methylase UbiE